MSEPRLLLMAGTIVADELFEARRPGGGGAAATDLARLEALAAKAEAIAEALEMGLRPVPPGAGRRTTPGLWDGVLRSDRPLRTHSTFSGLECHSDQEKTSNNRRGLIITLAVA